MENYRINKVSPNRQYIYKSTPFFCYYLVSIPYFLELYRRNIDITYLGLMQIGRIINIYIYEMIRIYIFKTKFIRKNVYYGFIELAFYFVWLFGLYMSMINPSNNLWLHYVYVSSFNVLPEDMTTKILLRKNANNDYPIGFASSCSLILGGLIYYNFGWNAIKITAIMIWFLRISVGCIDSMRVDLRKIVIKDERRVVLKIKTEKSSTFHKKVLVSEKRNIFLEDNLSKNFYIDSITFVLWKVIKNNIYWLFFIILKDRKEKLLSGKVYNKDDEECIKNIFTIIFSVLLKACESIFYAIENKKSNSKKYSYCMNVLISFIASTTLLLSLSVNKIFLKVYLICIGFSLATYFQGYFWHSIPGKLYYKHNKHTCIIKKSIKYLAIVLSCFITNFQIIIYKQGEPEIYKVYYLNIIVASALLVTYIYKLYAYEPFITIKFSKNYYAKIIQSFWKRNR